MRLANGVRLQHMEGECPEDSASAMTYLRLFESGPTDTGMRRLSLDDNDAKAREWFVEETKRLGCTKHIVDEVRLASRRSKRLQLY
jgi:hypothetical protein